MKATSVAFYFILFVVSVPANAASIRVSRCFVDVTIGNSCVVDTIGLTLIVAGIGLLVAFVLKGIFRGLR